MEATILPALLTSHLMTLILTFLVTKGLTDLSQAYRTSLMIDKWYQEDRIVAFARELIDPIHQDPENVLCISNAASWHRRRTLSFAFAVWRSWKRTHPTASAIAIRGASL